MTFIAPKFLHVAFMFMGASLAIGPATLLHMVARSGDRAAILRVFSLAERLFRWSTAGYGLGIVFGLPRR